MFGGRRSYYRDSYGRTREDRGRRPGIPGKWALIALLVLAAIMVIASLAQSSYHTVVRGSSYHTVVRSSSYHEVVRSSP
jgi:hypothetical protein